MENSGIEKHESGLSQDKEDAAHIERLTKRIPITMRAVVSHLSGQIRRDVLAELVAALSPVVGMRREDIDDTLGEGMSDLIDLESQMAGGGIFGAGGMTAGGIFGEAPIATNLSDPAAEERRASVNASRALMGEGRQEPVPAAVAPALSEQRRKALLGKGDSKE